MPQVGDVVRVPSKWPGEWDVAQVDFVQVVSSRGAVEVDLLPLKPVGDNLWRLPGRKPTSIRADIATIGRLDADYVRESDAFRVPPAQLAPTGRRKPADPDAAAAAMAEYEALKAELLREAAIVGVVGAAAAAATIGTDAAITFGAGSIAGCTYLALLGSKADGIGAEEQPRVIVILSSARLLVPAVLMVLLAARQSASGAPIVPFAALPKETFAAAALGFLSYKAPLLARQFIRAISDLGEEAASAPIGTGALPTGSLGVAVRALKQRQTSNEERARSQATAAGRAAALPKQIVLAGPSGVGKSTLIAKLLQEEPDLFGFSVSTTTRAPRAGEVEGVAYYFVSREDFEAMIARGDFLEWAQIGGDLYGTSIAAVRAVAATEKLCLLDVDPQGVEAIYGRSELSPFFIWVAPPTFASLRERLQSRGTEADDEIDRRVARAREEIEFSITTNYFDKTVVNDKLEAAYSELRAAIRSATKR